MNVGISTQKFFNGKLGFAALLGALVMVPQAGAHCDSWDGPILNEASAAFHAGDVAPVLKWVAADQENVIREAFDRAQSASAAGSSAEELAEEWFLETLVRIHREGEGATYTGLHPAGGVDKAVALADQSLVTGSAEALAGKLGHAIQAEIERRYAVAAELRGKADKSPEEGRRYVAAYVDYVHFVEAIHLALKGEGHGH